MENEMKASKENVDLYVDNVVVVPRGSRLLPGIRWVGRGHAAVTFMKTNSPDLMKVHFSSVVERGAIAIGDGTVYVGCVRDENKYVYVFAREEDE